MKKYLGNTTIQRCHSTCEGCKLVSLLHDACLPLGEGGVAPQLAPDELHLDLDPPPGLLAGPGHAAAEPRQLLLARVLLLGVILATGNIGL